MTNASPPDRREVAGGILNRALRPSSKHVEAARRLTPTLWVFAVLLLSAALLIEKDFFGFSSQVQRYSSDLVNQAITGPLYPDKGHANIAAVMINDQTLRLRGEHWPIAYRTHKLVLDALLPFCPRAVVVDFLFIDNRATDPTLGELLNEIRRYKSFDPKRYGLANCNRPNGIPLYFEQTSSDPVLLLIRDTKVELVDPTITLTDGVARQYPVSLCTHGQPSCMSLAVRVFHDLCASGQRSDTKDLCPNPVPALRDRSMELWWGTAPDPINVKLSESDTSYSACNKNFSILGRIARAVFDPGSLRSTCPYHSVIPAEALLNGGVENGKPDKDIPNLVHDRIVFYGASLSGIGDQAPTPVNSILPDVFVHATALDNLVSLKNGPLYAADDDGWLTRNVKQFLLGIPVVLFLSLFHTYRLRRRQTHEHGRGVVGYIVNVIKEFFLNAFAVCLAIGAGVAATLLAQVAISTWIGLVFVSLELGGILALGIPDGVWGYARHVVRGEEVREQNQKTEAK